MAIRNLRFENDEILRKRSREVEQIDNTYKISDVIMPNKYLTESSNKVLTVDALTSLPPTTLIFEPCSANTDLTSTYRGSPTAPGSLVLSRTAIVFAVSGIAARNFSTAKGL